MTCLKLILGKINNNSVTISPDPALKTAILAPDYGSGGNSALFWGDLAPKGHSEGSPAPKRAKKAPIGQGRSRTAQNMAYSARKEEKSNESVSCGWGIES